MEEKELGIMLPIPIISWKISGKFDDYPVLKISAYPFSKGVIEDITSRCGEVLILEEGAPLVEESLRGILDNGIKIYGRLDGTVPRDGELNPAIVAKALGIPVFLLEGAITCEMRPPSFC
jgi:indolepyruvate ferredoxin oxidoreductase alpha subunit